MISILMPVKNAENYLQECLNSIVDQSYTDWELIAVNDHSQDRSRDILNQYAESDSRIRVFENLAQGIIEALKLAYSKAKGEFISRMDADDIMAEDKLATLKQTLSNEPDAVATSYVTYFSEGELGEGYQNYAAWLNNLIDHKNHYEHIYKECVLPSPNWMMHRNTLDRIGGFSNLIYPEDYDLAFKLYELNIPIIGIKEVLHHWRDYESRTSRTDDNYKDNRFLEIKMKYFLKLDKSPENNLFVWGAGKKGKEIAKLLLERNISFKWITNNKNKLQAPIYGIQLESTGTIQAQQHAQIIIAVAGPDDQNEIRKRLEEFSSIQAFWFA